MLIGLNVTFYKLYVIIIYWIRGMLKIMNKVRLKELDILRATAFIFVVAQHTLGGFSNAKGINYFDYTVLKFLYVIAKTAVPIFLFISGVSLFYVYSDKFDWKKYYIKRFKYIFIPYVIWSAINMIKLGNEDRFQNFIEQIIAGNGGFHLWYMGMIIRLYLIFPLILWICKKIHSINIKIRSAIFIALSVLFYAISRYQNIIADNISVFLFKNPTDLQHRMINISILFWFYYFILGAYFALNYSYIKEKVLKYKSILLVTYIFLFIYAYLNELDAIPFVRALSLLYPIFSILTFYIICIYLSSKNTIYSSMNLIGKYSFVSYMAHIIVINGLYARINYLVKDYLIFGVLLWISTFIITPLLFAIISYIPCSQYITGVKNRSKLKDLFNNFRNHINNSLAG